MCSFLSPFLFFSVFFFVIRSYFKEKISLKSTEQFPYNPTIDCPAKNKKEKKMTSCDLEISSYSMHLFILMCMLACLYVHIYMWVQVLSEILALLKLQLMPFVYNLMWVLGTKFRSSGRAMSAVNQWVISALYTHILDGMSNF